MIQIRPHIILIDDLSLSFLLYITDTLSTRCNPTTDWLNFYWVRDESRRVKSELLINSGLIDYKDLWPIAQCCTMMFVWFFILYSPTWLRFGHVLSVHSLFYFFIKGIVIHVAHNHSVAYFSDIPKYDVLILIYQKWITINSIVLMLQLSNTFWPIHMTSSYFRCNFASM